ncbi:MAG: 2-C-methyl-D-erythritol 4-phosphate cytidylyltransferase [Candidatus Melainabacteria bacterium]|nr:MAG: 2-C-methyl-D-erythritol 4-phosphate cytidylyltransferase [Candidatus Melainabacteria bacterium]
MNKVAAIVVAGGRGERCATSEELPKQLLILGGQPVFIWSVKVFCQHPNVDEVVLVVLSNLLESFQKEVRKYLPDSLAKLKFVSGGSARQSSVLSGLEYLAKQASPPKFVLIHDAVRPFLDRDDLDRVITSLADDRGCTLAVPVTDTLKQVKNDLVTDTLDRRGLYCMQTPQGGAFSLLLAAHRKMASEGIETTDDANVLERAGIPVQVVIGSPRNFKITTAEDFHLAQAIANSLKEKNGARHYI